MAQKIQVMLLCDLDDSNVEAAETVRFSLGNATYEVDVCGQHAQQIRDGLEPFVAHARKSAMAHARKSVTTAGSRRRRERPAAGRDQTASIRSWARDHGIQVNDRGRIAASVMKEYEAATGK